MIKPKQLKVGLLVWWVSERYMSSWNCPGVITMVNHKDNKYRVRTFDTMEESENLSIVRKGPDGSSLEEMRIATTEEVLDYIEAKKGQFDLSVIRAEEALKMANEAAKKYNQKANLLCKELTQRTPEQEGVLPKI